MSDVSCLYTDRQISAMSEMEVHDLMFDEIEASNFAGDFTSFVDFLIDNGNYPASAEMTQENVFEMFCEHKRIVRTGLDPYTTVKSEISTITSCELSTGPFPF